MTDVFESDFGLLKDAIQMMGAEEHDSALLDGLKERTDDIGELARMLEKAAQRVTLRDRELKHLRRVIPIGVSLLAEKDFNRILETVVVEAQALTKADGGTLYLLEDEKYLKFVIMRNTSLGIAMGGTNKSKIAFNPVNLYNEDGSENRNNVASYAALMRERVNIADAYEAKGFDFSGTKAFDQNTGYRSKSFLTYPLEDVTGKVIGVLQLINAKDWQTGEIIPFDDDNVLEALVSLATAALAGYIREEELRQEIAQLRIEIDESRRVSQVAAITDTHYFKYLQDKARELREQDKKK